MDPIEDTRRMTGEQETVLRKVEQELMPRYYETAQAGPDDPSDTYLQETLQEAYYTIWALVDIIHKMNGDK